MLVESKVRIGGHRLGYALRRTSPTPACRARAREVFLCIQWLVVVRWLGCLRRPCLAFATGRIVRTGGVVPARSIRRCMHRVRGRGPAWAALGCHASGIRGWSQPLLQRSDVRTARRTMHTHAPVTVTPHQTLPCSGVPPMPWCHTSVTRRSS
jgi:hypothetical protein